MLDKPIAANLLRVEVFMSTHPPTVGAAINEWLDKHGTTAVQDIQIAQGAQTVAMVVYRKG